MPLDRQAAFQLGLLVLILPAQYLITTYFGASGSQKEYQLKQLAKSVTYYTSEYLSWQKWGEWCVELLGKVRTQLTPALQSPQPGDVLGDEGESPAIEVIKFRNPEGYFASSTERRSPRPANIKYRVGQVVRHKFGKYRGVIIGWDTVAKAPQAWLDKTYKPEEAELRKTPHYLLLVDIRDDTHARTEYISQEHLELLQRTQVLHPQVQEYFDSFDGFQFILRSRLKVLYPNG
jgi:hemimethylated DNA binding protein